MHGWLDHQERQSGVFHSPQEARDAFARLLRALPLDRMDRRFISDVVMRAADVQALDGQGWAIMSSLLADPAFGGQPARPPTSIFGTSVEEVVRIPAASCRGQALGESRKAALLLGVPLVVNLYKSYIDGTVKLEWGLALPDRQAALPPNAERPPMPVTLDVELAEAAARLQLLHVVTPWRLVPGHATPQVAKNVFKQPWDEVFKEKSRFVNDKDELVLRLRVKMEGAVGAGGGGRDRAVDVTLGDDIIRPAWDEDWFSGEVYRF